MKVVQVAAGDVRRDDELVNMGVVTDVHGAGDVVLIEWRGPFIRFIGTHTTLGKTFDATAELYRMPREGEA